MRRGLPLHLALKFNAAPEIVEREGNHRKGAGTSLPAEEMFCRLRKQEQFQQHKTMAVESAAATLVRKEVSSDANRFHVM